MFYDTHAHLDFQDFAGDLDDVLERAIQAGVTRVVTVGTDFASSQRAVELAEQHPALFAVVGWHPSTAFEAPDDIRPLFRDLVGHPKVVALGETGLDDLSVRRRTSDASAAEQERDKQRRLFAQHLDLAAASGLNVVVHQREALDVVLAMMEPFRDRLRGQFHCFVGDRTALEKILATGSIVSFTGILTFKNAADLRETLVAAPLGSFMLETDCPYLAPVPHRGKRCEPAHLVETARVVAAIKQTSLEALGRATCATAHQFFAKLEPGIQ